MEYAYIHFKASCHGIIWPMQDSTSPLFNRRDFSLGLDLSGAPMCLVTLSSEGQEVLQEHLAEHADEVRRARLS